MTVYTDLPHSFQWMNNIPAQCSDVLPDSQGSKKPIHSYMT